MNSAAPHNSLKLSLGLPRAAAGILLIIRPGCNKLGLTEVRRRVDEKNKYTLVFLAAPRDGELVGKGADGRGAPGRPRIT